MGMIKSILAIKLKGLESDKDVKEDIKFFRSLLDKLEADGIDVYNKGAFEQWIETKEVRKSGITAVADFGLRSSSFAATILSLSRSLSIEESIAVLKETCFSPKSSFPSNSNIFVSGGRMAYLGEDKLRSFNEWLQILQIFVYRVLLRELTGRNRIYKDQNK